MHGSHIHVHRGYGKHIHVHRGVCPSFSSSVLFLIVIGEEPLTILITGVHNGAGGRYFEHPGRQPGEESPNPVGSSHNLGSDCPRWGGGRRPGRRHLEDFRLTQLDLTLGFYHIHGQSEGARDPTSQESGHDISVVDYLVFRCRRKETFKVFHKRPVQCREGNVSENAKMLWFSPILIFFCETVMSTEE